MSDDVLVKVDNVSKRFCRSLKRSLWYGLQDLGSEIGGRRHGGGSGQPQSSADVPLRPDEFWAVKDMSFELRRGECLGLIGRNGAGKTTLLRMLNGLIKPDTGRIEMKGRVGALIALGAGFNPLLTGKENIFINAGIYGFTEKQINAKLEEIIDFSGISKFIDSPVQTYSSGMQVRLGFAVTTLLDPDILIIDEILAVGDNEFRLKCIDRINSISANCSIIFVSHSSAQITAICNRGLLLSEGMADSRGVIPAGDALLLYYNEAHLRSKQRAPLIEKRDVIRMINSILESRENKSQLYCTLEIISNAELCNCDLLTTIITADGTHIAQSAIGLPAIKRERLYRFDIIIDTSLLISQNYTFYQLLRDKKNIQLVRLTGFPPVTIHQAPRDYETYAPIYLPTVISSQQV